MSSPSEISFLETPSNNTTGNWTFDLESILGPRRDPLSTVVPMTLVYALLLVTGIIGNVCTCVVISRNRYMHTATNYYLFSLAVSDLLLLVLGLPQEIYQLWERYPYVFGEVFCIIRGLSSETSTNASILTITAFTMERYLAICHPLRARTMSKLSRAVKFIVCIWICGALCAIPLAYQFGIVYETDYSGRVLLVSATCTLKRELDHSFEILTAVFFFLPMTLLSVIYVLIALKLRKSVQDQNRSVQPYVWSTNGVQKFGKQLSRSSTRRSSSRKAVVKMLVAVVVAFFICWAPFHAQRLMAIYVLDPTPADIVTFTALTYISGVTYYVSATINPILYSIMSLKFRHAFRDTLSHCLGRRVVRRGRFNMSRYNTTVRSGGFDATDFTLVSESPQMLDDDQSKKTSFSNMVCDDNNVPSIYIQGDQEDAKKAGSSISNSSLQMLDDDVFEAAELSEYMEKLKDTRG